MRVFIGVTSFVNGAFQVCSLSRSVSVPILRSPQISALCLRPLGLHFHFRGFKEPLKLPLFSFLSRNSMNVSSESLGAEKVCLRNLRNLWTVGLLWIKSSVFWDNWSLCGVTESPLGLEVSMICEFEQFSFLKMYYSDNSWANLRLKITEAGIHAGKVSSPSQNTQTPFPHTLVGWFRGFNQTNLCVLWHRGHKNLAVLPQHWFASQPFVLWGDGYLLPHPKMNPTSYKSFRSCESCFPGFRSKFMFGNPFTCEIYS